jgi:hypothetical protein
MVLDTRRQTLRVENWQAILILLDLGDGSCWPANILDEVWQMGHLSAYVTTCRSSLVVRVQALARRTRSWKNSTIVMKELLVRDWATLPLALPV